MLSVLVTLPQERGGLDASVIYIDTEAAFSATRLGILCGGLCFTQGNGHEVEPLIMQFLHSPLPYSLETLNTSPHLKLKHL